MPAAFRFAAKRVLLTYSDVCEEITKETVLYDICERTPSLEWSIAEETHPRTGGRHIHALIQFTHRVDTRDVRFFDIGDSAHQHHPNIQPVQYGKSNWEKALAYVQKEDPTPLTNIEPKLTYEEIYDTANSQEEFLQLVKKHHGRDFALNISSLERTAEKLWPTTSVNTVMSARTPSPQRTPFELTTTDPHSAWGTLKSLVVTGPPGVGKTTWALHVAPKPCLFVRHLDSLKKLRPSHRSIVFDDLEFDHLPPATQKFLVDMEQIAEIHVRYGVATIPQGLPRIFTANVFPFTRDGVHGVAIKRRLKEVIIL